MPKYADGPLDVIFRALGDPLRRRMLTRLQQGPASVGELAALGPVSLPTTMQHLDQLRAAGLVTSHKVGRVRSYELIPGAYDEAIAWLMGARTTAEQRLDRLDRFLKENPT